jgi:hypothetical protein
LVNSRNASRSELRDTAKSALSAASDKRCPGFSSPLISLSRIASARRGAKAAVGSVSAMFIPQGAGPKVPLVRCIFTSHPSIGGELRCLIVHVRNRSKAAANHGQKLSLDSGKLLIRVSICSTLRQSSRTIK